MSHQHQYEMAYESNNHVTDDVRHVTSKAQNVTPCIEPNISKTAGDAI